MTSSGCRWWAWSQRSAGSVWPEGRWRIKGIPWTSRPSWAAGVDCKDHIWLWYTFIIQKKKTTIKSSVLFSGLAWSTWWERWNWRRWSNGKILIVYTQVIITSHVSLLMKPHSLFCVGSTWSPWSKRPLRTPRSWWPSGTSWRYWQPWCCRRKGKRLISVMFSSVFTTCFVCVAQRWTLLLIFGREFHLFLNCACQFFIGCEWKHKCTQSYINSFPLCCV